MASAKQMRRNAAKITALKNRQIEIRAAMEKLRLEADTIARELDVLSETAEEGDPCCNGNPLLYRDLWTINQNPDSKNAFQWNLPIAPDGYAYGDPSPENEEKRIRRDLMEHQLNNYF